VPPGHGSNHTVLSAELDQMNHDETQQILFESMLHSMGAHLTILLLQARVFDIPDPLPSSSDGCGFSLLEWPNTSTAGTVLDAER